MVRILKDDSFTLIELIMVLVIISILVSFAIPRYSLLREKARTAEAIGLLTAIRSAQLRYYYENNETYASNISDLDISFPSTKYFTVDSPPSGLLGKVTRNNNPYFGNYSLCINETGTISCCSEGIDCPVAAIE